jgi:hypothetical protein
MLKPVPKPGEAEPPFDGAQVGNALAAQIKGMIDTKFAGVEARFAALPPMPKQVDPVVNVMTPEYVINLPAPMPTPVTVAPNLNFTASPVEVTVDLKELSSLIGSLLTKPMPPDNSEAVVKRIEAAAESINAQMKSSSAALVAALTAEKTIVNGPDGKPASLKVK